MTSPDPFQLLPEVRTAAGPDPFQLLGGEQDRKRGDGFFDYVLGQSGGPLGSFMSAAGGGLTGSLEQSSFPFGAGGSGSGSRWLEGLMAKVGQARPRAVSGPQPPGASGSPGTSAPGISGSVGRASTHNTRIAQKIVQTAQGLGMDPEFALWVAENEGGLDDAAANRQNYQGSQAYGPYQLLLQGGLGDEALKAGIDPRDAGSVDRQIEFALQHARQYGWGAWEAVTKRGIDPWTGVRSGASMTSHAGAGPPAAPQAQRTPTPAPGGGYGTYATLGPDAYTTAFDFDQPYTNPWSPNIPNHRGVDLQVKGAPDGGRGSRVGAFHPGQVVAVTHDENGGNGVIIQGEDGLYHRYFHFDNILVKQGDVVGRGTPIGILGASGTEGFPHLHYEVSRGLNGDPAGRLVDPRPYLQGAR